MAVKLPLSYALFNELLANYIRGFRLSRIKIKSDYTLFENKEADLKIIYWKNTGLFYINYLGVDYYVTGATLPRPYRDHILYSKEPIEYTIQAEPDGYRLKPDKFVFILVNYHPATSTEGAVSMLLLDKKRIAVDQVLGVTRLNINRFIRVPDIETAMEQAVLEAPSIIASIASGTVDEAYTHWIESYKWNME